MNLIDHILASRDEGTKIAASSINFMDRRGFDCIGPAMKGMADANGNLSLDDMLQAGVNGLVAGAAIIGHVSHDKALFMGLAERAFEAMTRRMADIGQAPQGGVELRHLGNFEGGKQ